MARITYVNRKEESKFVLFECPGCCCSHGVPVEGPRAWGFNGDMDRPTLTPSLLVQSVDETGPTVCHSFVRDGRIQYLGDCTHDMKGQTVDLPEFDVD